VRGRPPTSLQSPIRAGLKHKYVRGGRALLNRKTALRLASFGPRSGAEEKADEAMKQLEADGYIRTAPQGRAVLFHVVKPYRRP
jgi:hypothetical protein